MRGGYIIWCDPARMEIIFPKIEQEGATKTAVATLPIGEERASEYSERR